MCLRKIDEAILQLNITKFPHDDEKNAREFIASIMAQRRRFDPAYEDRKLDRSKLNQLRDALKTRRAG